MKFTKIITYFLFHLLVFTSSPDVCKMAAYCFSGCTLDTWLYNCSTAATFLPTQPACLKHISLILNTTKTQLQHYSTLYYKPGFVLDDFAQLWLMREF